MEVWSKDLLWVGGITLLPEKVKILKFIFVGSNFSLQRPEAGPAETHRNLEQACRDLQISWSRPAETCRDLSKEAHRKELGVCCRSL